MSGTEHERPAPPPELPVEIPMEIPPDALDADVLRGIVREFVLREGTDYGAVEIELEVKIQQLLRQIEKGDIKIFFDASTETVTLTGKNNRPL